MDTQQIQYGHPFHFFSPCTTAPAIEYDVNLYVYLLREIVQHDFVPTEPLLIIRILRPVLDLHRGNIHPQGVHEEVIRGVIRIGVLHAPDVYIAAAGLGSPAAPVDVRDLPLLRPSKRRLPRRMPPVAPRRRAIVVDRRRRGTTATTRGHVHLPLQFDLGEPPRDRQPDAAERHPRPDEYRARQGRRRPSLVNALGARAQKYQEGVPREYPHHRQQERRPLHARDAEDVVEHAEGYEAIQAHERHDAERVADHGGVDGPHHRVPSQEHLDEVARHVLGAPESHEPAEDASQKARGEGYRHPRHWSPEALEDEAGREDHDARRDEDEGRQDQRENVGPHSHEGVMGHPVQKGVDEARDPSRPQYEHVEDHGDQREYRQYGEELLLPRPMEEELEELLVDGLVLDLLVDLLRLEAIVHRKRIRPGRPR